MIQIKNRFDGKIIHQGDFKTISDHMPGLHDPDFVYKLGETHRPDLFDPDERHDCRPGLHFFTTFSEAENWR